MDDTIKDKAHLESLTDIPVIGVIGHNNRDTNLIVPNHPKSMVSEGFRSIRTNLQYLGSQTNTNQIILINSVVGSEGKSFSSVNLGAVLAMTNKKVVLLGLDLRKPRLHLEFDSDNDVGVSNYLVRKLAPTISSRIQAWITSLLSLLVLLRRILPS
jgi:Mrp family chromosome partitioning ATPase